MSKGLNQKQKMLYLVKIFQEETDEEHGITLERITDLLNSHEVNADRKTLYQDFDELRAYGFDIYKEQKERTFNYRLLSRDFQLAEVKLLVESVQAAKFMTEKKSQELIKKLEGLVSRHAAGQLDRQLYIPERVKSMNESIYYSIDLIHNAINTNRKISFQYLQWNTNRRLVVRHNGARYNISPLALVLDNENYYLIGYDEEAQLRKHFRVDKMKGLEIMDEEIQCKKITKREISQYTNRVFNMFGGEKHKVTIEAPNEMVGIFLDRFGKSATIVKKGPERFKLRVEVEVSLQFLGWLAGLGPEVRLTEPQAAVEQMKDLLAQLGKLYN